jgi:hypothetical protein
MGGDPEHLSQPTCGILRDTFRLAGMDGLNHQKTAALLQAAVF